MKIASALLFFLVCSCAYRIGHHSRQLPGGYKKVYINMFENLSTQEVGMETDLTQAMISEFSRSGLGQLTGKDQAELIITGKIHTFDTRGQTPIATAGPRPRPFFTEQQAQMSVMVVAIDKKTNKEIWQGQFVGEKYYKSPQITKPTLRTANPLYNQSARRQVIRSIAKDVAAEAIVRMSENF